MMIVPSNVKVHLALGVTDMRKGLDGLATLVQETLKKDPFCGHAFAFRGQRTNLVKLLFWDGTGLCLFTKQIDRGYFVWPRMSVRESRSRCRRRSSRCCSKASNGGIPSASGSLRKRAEKLHSTRSKPAELLGFRAAL